MGRLGTVELSNDILQRVKVGLWAFEFDDGCPPRMYVDDTMFELLGLSELVSPEDTYHAWYDRISPAHYKTFAESVDKMIAGEQSEVQFLWNHPKLGLTWARCGGVRNYQYTKGIRLEGTYQDVNQVSHFQLANLEQHAPIKVFSDFFVDTFVSAYYVCLKDLSCVIYNRLQELENKYPITASYLEPFTKYINNDVHPEDQQMMLELVQPETIRAKLQTEKSFSVIMRDISGNRLKYYRFQVIRGADDEHCALGFIDVTKELATKAVQDNNSRQYDEVIRALAQDFDLVCLVNPETMEYHIYRLMFDKKKRIPQWDNIEGFENRLNYLKEAVVHPEDRELFARCTSMEWILSKLKESGFYSFNYRNLLRGEVSYWQAKFVLSKTKPVEVICGFRETTQEVLRENAEKALLNKHLNIIRSLSETYISIYYLNLEQKSYEVVAYDSTSLNNQLKPNEDAVEFFKSCWDFIHPEDVPGLQAISDYDKIYQLLRHKREHKTIFRKQCESGYKYLEMTLVKAEEADEVPCSVAVGFADIDKRYRAELNREELRQAYEADLKEARIKAEQANQAKTTFLFNMSHDLRTPLNAILGFANVAVRNPAETERVSDCVNKIKVAGTQLLTLLNDVLELSRIESGQVKIDCQPSDVDSLGRLIGNTFAPMLSAKNLAFTYKSEVRDSNVWADKCHIDRILFNVVGNAVKFTPKGGSIACELKQLQDLPDGRSQYCWSVSDTGIGMTKAFQKCIFERFSRERTSTESGVEGTGLGMSTVKELVELMGGQIEVESEKGKGTTVSFTLSLNRCSADEVASRSRFEVNNILALLKGKRVLVVEDNELNREIIVDIVQTRGMQVEEAVDGAVAVDLFRKNGPDYYDFVLMDIQMPIMNGYLATRAIRDMYPYDHVPIIAVSANAFDEDKRMSLEVGMDAHIVKPIKIDELLTTLKMVI